MSIPVDCPVCGHHFIRPDGLAGMSEKCPRCREVLIVPGKNSHFKPPVAGQANRYQKGPTSAASVPPPPAPPPPPPPVPPVPPAPQRRPPPLETPPAAAVPPAMPAAPPAPQQPVSSPAKPASDLDMGLDDIELLP